MIPREIHVCADVAAMAAEFVGRALSESIRERGNASFVLSGGGTPLSLYRRLAVESDRVEWERVHFYWGDERLIPPDQDGSNYGQAAEVLLGPLTIPAANIHRMKGELPAAEAALDYANQLRQHGSLFGTPPAARWPRFDVVLAGLGEDGHTASLFPGSATDSPEPVIAVTADYAGRPAHRLTLTPPVINDARRVFFLVTGASKANAVAATLQGPEDLLHWPAQRIRPENGRVYWLIDAPAAGELVL